MDLHIRYWDLQNNVVAQFYGADFSWKFAKNMLHGFETCLGALPKEKMI